MQLDDTHVRYLNGQSLGRLATVGPDGGPQNKPVAFQYNAAQGTIDIAGFTMGHSAKFRNIGINPQVAFVVDDVVGEGPSGLRFLEVRGHAEQARTEGSTDEGPGSYLIRIRPRRLVSWNLDPEHPGMQTQDIPADTVRR
jgi:pyridoxamine 5'-phosphate oxidase family protein